MDKPEKKKLTEEERKKLRDALSTGKECGNPGGKTGVVDARLKG